MMRTYSELMSLNTFEERFAYLALRGRVAEETFGHERPLNQRFYTSTEWRSLRNHIIARDEARDLAFPGYEIHRPAKIYIHHMNPMTPEDLLDGNPAIVNPEFLITVSHQVHNGIHYGDINHIPRTMVERRPGDTKLW